MSNSAIAPRLRPNSGPAVWGPGLIFLGALAALILTTYRYFAPLSGITGTYGALLAMFGAAALIVAAFAIASLEAGPLRTTFLVLSWIGAVLTLAAAWLLHGWWASLALILCLAGVAIATVSVVRKKGGPA